MIQLDVEKLGRQYRSATPYPYVVIDDFLPADLAARLATDFPPLDSMSKVFREPMSYKGQTSDISKVPKFLGIFAELQSMAFRKQIELITGIEDLLADDILAGGGLHQSPNSGFLDLHVDANFHPVDKSLHRRVNLLVYLNTEWHEDWGGQFEIWRDRNKKPETVADSIYPVFNRAVIFSTSRTSWHGVAPVKCPAGQSRKSLALYYYTTARPSNEIYVDSSVIWHNRSVPWKRILYPILNFGIARLKPYARHFHRKGIFDAAGK